ncbi:MAG TPA: glycosyltransferase [Solirubrobacteraceae bacterium]|nr:glycosyltransferase [Solirubrobacteraceae bacterium]
MNVGAVIATRNRRDSLLRTLAHLAALPERPPIVVVDNGSEDGTADAVRSAHPDVRVIGLEGNAGGAARTEGVRLLATEAVAFSDDDSWWAPDALARAARILDDHPRLALIAARVLVGAGATLDPTCLEMADSPLAGSGELPGPPILGFLACGAIVRREAYLEVGGFEPRLGVGGEEQLLALDLAVAGWGLVYVEDIVAHHHPRRGEPGRENRRGIQLRNDMWSAWLRRPPAPALRITGALAAACVREGLPRVLIEAARGLPWALRERRPLPPEVELAARRLSSGGSG